MNKKFFFSVMPVIILVFGMAVVGCDNDPTDDPTNGGADTWSNVTSFNQMNGTWKGSYSQTQTFQEFWGWTDEEWTEYGMDAIFGNDMKISMTVEMTQTINASAKTRQESMKMTMAFSGSKIATVWEELKGEFVEEGVTVNDSNHSMTMTETLPSEPISDEEISEMLEMGIQINQNGTKIKLPAGLMGEDDSPEIIMVKQ